MDLACHQLETIWQEKTTRETSQAMERRPGQILERHDMAEESTRQGSLETACWGLRPTTGHNGCLMMMKNTYECLTITTHALPSVIIYCDAYEMLRAFLANFRNMFLIFATQHERPRMLIRTPRPTNVWRSLCDHCKLMANCIRKPIRHIFATVWDQHNIRNTTWTTATYECLAITCDYCELMANCIRKPIRHIFVTAWEQHHKVNH